MELSILIAKITAIVYLSAAAGAICSADYYRRMTDDLFKNTALTYLLGFIAIILGSLMVNYHNLWEMNWTVLISILGWLVLIKGILIMAFPGVVQNFSRPIFEGRGLYYFPYMAVLLGFLFGYFGFMY